jgi:ParB family chromosome partitioning protein
MLSGEFHSIPIDQIVVPPRVREDFGDSAKEANSFASLVDSIRRNGLIHPIVVTRDLELSAGERRLRACKSLGHDRIMAQYLDEVDETRRRERH